MATYPSLDQSWDALEYPYNRSDLVAERRRFSDSNYIPKDFDKTRAQCQTHEDHNDFIHFEMRDFVSFIRHEIVEIHGDLHHFDNIDGGALTYLLCHCDNFVDGTTNISDVRNYFLENIDARLYYTNVISREEEDLIVDAKAQHFEDTDEDIEMVDSLCSDIATLFAYMECYGD